jgi:hypothetical protein
MYSYSAPWTPPPPARVYVNPQTVMNRSLTPGNNFTIEVRISEATNVSLCNFMLNFNSSLIKAREVSIGTFFPPSTILTIETNNVTGFIHVFASLPSSESPRGGSGTLATIEFHVEAIGYSSLSLADTILKDKKSHLLPFNTADGYFTNSVILGDVNGDGKVDVQDIARVSAAFGSYPNDSRWNPAADLDKDGVVLVRDIAIVCQNFGQPHS